MTEPKAKAIFTEEEVTLIMKYLNLAKIILGFVGLFQESDKVNAILDKLTTPEPMETTEPVKPVEPVKTTEPGCESSEEIRKTNYDKVGDVFEE